MGQSTNAMIVYGHHLGSDEGWLLAAHPTRRRQGRRRQMPDLNEQIREHLGPIPTVDEWLNWSRRTRSALLAIAAMHVPGGTTGNYGYVICAGCPNDTPHSECPELLAIARELGIEVEDDHS